MRILWVKIGGLWPPHSGGRLRSLELLRELSKSHPVTVLTTHSAADDPAGLAAALPSCEVLSWPYAAPKVGSPRFAAALVSAWLRGAPADLWRWRVKEVRNEATKRLTSGAVDICVVDFLVGAFNVPEVVGIPRVLFEHNVEHRIWERLAQRESHPLRRKLMQVESRQVRRYEAVACKAADLTIAVSPVDREALEGLAPGARVRSISTGVDTAYFQANGATPKKTEMVFTGSMDWYPNEDGMLHFIADILPRVRAQIPEASLTIAGRTPSKRLRSVAERSGVRLTGTVDDIRPFIDAASVYVVPLRIGGGTRLKIVEALSMSKAVVSTSVGAEGLPLEPGEHFVRADEPDEFARAVVWLLQEPATRSAFGRAGRELVEKHHSWPSVAREMVNCLEEAAACA